VPTEFLLICFSQTNTIQAARDPDDEFAEGAFEQLVAEAGRKDDKKDKQKAKNPKDKAKEKTKEDESHEEVKMPGSDAGSSAGRA
jgi:hypothetical protein